MTAGWSADRVEALTRLWSAELSASQVAETLGEVSRNAVIGKLHRLGFAARAPATRSRPGPIAQPHLRPSAPMPNPKLPTRCKVAAPVDVAARGWATVLTLGPRCCRWPIGEPASPGFSFCGRRALRSAYCEPHAALAYTPNRKARAAATGIKSASRAAIGRSAG